VFSQIPHSLAVLSLAVAALHSEAHGVEPTAEQLAFFEAKVRPVLVEYCYECHSAAAKKVKGGLVVDTRAGLLAGGDSGPAIVPGDAGKSLLIQAVRHADADLKMPKQKLLDHQIADLRTWVEMGAPDPRSGEPPPSRRAAFDWEKERQHWAYQPVREPALPAVKETTWPRNEIDHFIRAKLEENRLEPVADADPRVLIRRVTFDLLGLPPTPEEVEAFVRESQEAPESRSPYEQLIRRLLASPHYGERWGRHWMDLVRYADTAGDNSDYPIPQAYLYRNYIIDAFNADKPFDQFIREQIAGDLLPASDQAERNEHIIATGYVAMSRRFGSVVDRYPTHLTIEDTIDNLGRTFLGLTVSCARCHDHKFDAITQRDYYALYGMFASTRYAFPGIELLKVQKDFVPLLAKAELHETLAPFLEKAAELQKAHDELAARRKEMEARKSELEKLVAAAPAEEKPKRAAEIAEFHQQIEKVRGNIRTAAAAIEKHEKQRPRVHDAYAVQDGAPADAALHLKGEPDRVGEKVPRRWLELFGASPVPAEVASRSSGRLQLAEWIADARNPLTARVIVNRVWQQHFGSGLVPTPSDFGVRGQLPTHPELLDWLASRFIADGWSIKKLHERILSSGTYQLASSAGSAVQLSADPDNHLHWRFNRRRLDAETLRDTTLAVSGALDPTPLREPHPFPPPQKWDYTQHHPFRASYPSTRRSVYLMVARLTASPFFQTFDGPDPNASTARRDSSVTTVQALYFMNDQFVYEQADRFAARVMKEAPDEQARVDRAFALALHRPPSAEERAQLDTYFTAARNRLMPVNNDPQKHQRAAWASLARALFRTNEFLYVD